MTGEGKGEGRETEPDDADPAARHRLILESIHRAMRHSGNGDCMTCALIAPLLDRYLREQDAGDTAATEPPSGSGQDDAADR